MQVCVYWFEMGEFYVCIYIGFEYVLGISVGGQVQRLVVYGVIIIFIVVDIVIGVQQGEKVMFGNGFQEDVMWDFVQCLFDGIVKDFGVIGDQQDFVVQVFCMFYYVGGEQDCVIGIGLGVDNVFQGFLIDWVEVGKWFVQDDEFWLVYQG